MSRKMVYRPDSTYGVRENHSNTSRSQHDRSKVAHRTWSNLIWKFSQSHRITGEASLEIRPNACQIVVVGHANQIAATRTHFLRDRFAVRLRGAD